MSETAFTPGPWHPVQYGPYFNIQDGPYYEDMDVLDLEKHEQAEDNARLAAAAPEMYELLLRIKQNEGMYPQAMGEINQLLNKINKPL